MTNTNWSSGETITISADDLDESGFSYSIDTASPSISSITIDTVDTSAFDDLISLDDINLTITEPKDFITHMPDVHEIEAMCEYYPALEKAYENFKTIYNMVKQDYVGNHKSNEAPF